MGADTGNSIVTVTGATGFIATHCILQLLQQGYRVRGTLRCPARQKEVIEGLAKHVEIEDRLEFVEADLLQDIGWDQAVVGARYVLHVASPVPTAPPKDEMEVIKPAREGVLRLLRASLDAGVERVVLTSSIWAIASGHERPPDRIFDEKDWSNLDRTVGAYEKSKTLAERAAWDFVGALSGDKKLELVAINPGLVLGPSLIPDYSVSAEVVGKLLRRDVPGCPDLNLALVDVRDVAFAHLVAMTHPDAAGKRFIVAGKNTPISEVARVLRDEFQPRGYKIPTRSVPDFLVRITGFFDKTIRLIVPELGKPINVSCRRAEEVLGFTHHSLRDMVVSTGESLIEHNLV